MKKFKKIFTYIISLMLSIVISAPAIAAGMSDIPERIDITGRISWQDNDNLNGCRPESVRVFLYENGSEIKSTTAYASNGWSFAFNIEDKSSYSPEYSITAETVKEYTEETLLHKDPSISVSYNTVNSWTKYEPCRELSIPADILKSSVIIGKMTGHKPIVVWSPKALSAAEQNAVLNSISGQPGAGNPGGAVFISGDGASESGMKVLSSAGKVVFEKTKNWALIYGGSYEKPIVNVEGGLIVLKESDHVLDPFTPGFDTLPEDETAPDPGIDVTEEPEPGPEIDITEEPESGPEIDITEEPESEPVIDITEEPESEPVIDIVEEPESEPEIDITEEPEAESEIDIIEKPEAEPESDITKEPESEPESDISEEPEAEPESNVTEKVDEYAGSNENTITSMSPELDDQPKTGDASYDSRVRNICCKKAFILNKHLKDLIKENKDTKAWIKIDGTIIDYPVMCRDDDSDYYLHKDIYGNESDYGSLYIRSKSSFKNDNTIIYGHNMKDGSMFAGLLKYEDYEFYKSHPNILLETETESAEYEIISVFRDKVHYKNETDVFKYYDYNGSLTKKEYDEYMKQIKEISLYDTDAEASYGDRLITLSTCSYHTENGRFVVVAVKKQSSYKTSPSQNQQL